MIRGDIFFVSLEPTFGHEQRGSRPVLVVTTEAFNRRTAAPVILPITNGGDFARNIGLAVSLDGFGLTTTGLVRCDQPRSIDLEARAARWIERVPEEVIEDVLDRLTSLFSSWKP